MELPLPFALYDDTANKEDIAQHFQDFIMIYAGSRDPQNADYKIPPTKVKDFLEELQRAGVRSILKDLYDRYEFPEDFVFFTSTTWLLFESLKRILTSPFRPWILIYGAEGSGKMSLIKAILGDKVLYMHELEDRHIGFRRELKEREIDDVVVKINLIQDQQQLNEIITVLYHGGYQAIFVHDGEKLTIPQSLSTIPSLRIPSFYERSLKEKILILEHLLRKLGSDAEISPGFIEVLFRYHWPGNITQLENTLRYILSLSDTVTEQALPLPIFENLKGDYNASIVNQLVYNMVNSLDYSNLSFELVEKIPRIVGQKILEALLHLANNDYSTVQRILNIENEEQARKLKQMFENYLMGEQ